MFPFDNVMISAVNWRQLLLTYPKMYHSEQKCAHFCSGCCTVGYGYDDVIKSKHFPHYWPFVWGIHRPPVNSPHKGQWRGALMFSLICVWINGWENNREAGDFRCYSAHYDVIVMRQAWVWRTVGTNFLGAHCPVECSQWTADSISSDNSFAQNRQAAITSTSSTPWSINTLRHRQNGRHFADDTFKRIFLKWKC